MTSTVCTCKNAIPSAGNCHEVALKMIFNREKYNWSMKVQIEFEKADMSNNTDYFKKNWEEYHIQFAVHSLATNGAFEWVNFRSWLRANPEMINTNTYLEEFEKLEKYSY